MPILIDQGWKILETNSIPELVAIEVENHLCTRCGDSWRTAVKPEYTDYRSEAAYWKEKYLSFGSELTELLKYTERHYGMNPAKDTLADSLEELRQKYSKDKDGHNDIR